jgi:hypothetical protein
LTKTDIAGTDTGSAGLLSLRKDVGADVAQGPSESIGNLPCEGGVRNGTETVSGAAFGSAGNWTNVTQSSTSGSGTGATYDLRIDAGAGGVLAIGLLTENVNGKGYRIGDTITLDDTTQGGTDGTSGTVALTATVVITVTELDVFEVPIPPTLRLANMSGDNKPDNVNPKQEILTAGVDEKGSSFEYSQPLFLASWQHGFAVGPSEEFFGMPIDNS